MGSLGGSHTSYNPLPMWLNVTFLVVAILLMVGGCRVIVSCRSDPQKKLNEKEIKARQKAATKARKQRVAERNARELAAARKKHKFAGEIVITIDERHLGSESDASERCVLTGRTEAGKKIALYVESRGEVKAMAVYGMAKPGMKVKFPKSNYVRLKKFPPETYGTWFDDETWTGTKGADQLEFMDP